MLIHKGTQEIKTSRLLLRRFKVEDAQVMYDNWANDHQVTRFLTWEPHRTIEVTKILLEMWCAEYEKTDYYQWGIELDGLLIGAISVVRHDDSSAWAELGYCIGKEWWGKGIMTEAAAAVTDYLFRETACNRIVIEHATENPGSGRVAQKCGFTKEGVKREYFCKNGVYFDIAIYSMLRSEWLTAVK